MQLEVQRKVDAQLAQREAQVRAQEQERAAQQRTQEHDRAVLQNAELQKKIDDMAAQMAEMQRRAEQGSQQLQGEVLELALEEGLRRKFPLDTIEEVKKGQRGGDVIHRITSRSGTAAGVLLWETKRAAVWNIQWLAKLKDDMRSCGADVGVLITMPGAVPKEWDVSMHFGLVDDVWVATWSCALQVAEMLRAGILDVHKQRIASAGKDEKMEAVYDYVTSAAVRAEAARGERCVQAHAGRTGVRKEPDPAALGAAREAARIRPHVAARHRRRDPGAGPPGVAAARAGAPAGTLTRRLGSHHRPSTDR